MLARIRRHSETIVVAAAVAAVVAGGPPLAAAVFDADNAHKVDGKHAVGAGASIDSRKGKLVATKATTGLLPNNIISKAPDADSLDGVDSSGYVDVAGEGDVVVQLPFHDWNTATAGVTRTYNQGDLTVSLSSTSSGVSFSLTPTLPTVLHGKSMELRGFELCYDASSTGTTLSNVQEILVVNSTGTTILLAELQDSTDRDDKNCRLYESPTPPLLTEDVTLSIHTTVAWSETGAPFKFSKAALFLRPFEGG